MVDFRFPVNSILADRLLGFEQILDVAGDAAVRLAAGGEPVPPLEYLWEEPEISSFRGGATTDLLFHKLHRVEVVGPGIILREGMALDPIGTLPHYVSNYISEGWLAGRFPDYARVTPGLPFLELETAFVPVHFNMNVYGHFLLEIVPRLMFIRELAITREFTQPIVLFAGTWPWVSKIVAEICPNNPIVTYDPRREGMRVVNALLPPMGSSPSYLFNRMTRTLLHQFANLSITQSKSVQRLFIIRDKPTSYRYLANHDELRAVCESLDFVAVAPEKLEWNQQVGLFHQAELVVGEYTSSLHNTVFCRPGTAVVALNRIDGLQDAIGASFRHRNGYLMPVDGIPRLFERNSTIRNDFEVSPTALRRRLETLLQRE